MRQLGWSIQTEITDGRTRVFLNPVGHRGLQVSIARSGGKGGGWPRQELQWRRGVPGEAKWALNEGQSAVRIHSTSHTKVRGRDGALCLGHSGNPGISPHHLRNPFSCSAIGSPISWDPHLPLSQWTSSF